MARIRKHRNKWQVLYRDPATGRERSAGTFARKSDATRQRQAVEYKTQTGEWIDPTLQATPYGEWAQTWIDTKSHLKPKTVATYESLFNSRILPRFGQARLRDIRVIDARAGLRQEAPDIVQQVKILDISPPIPNDTLSFGPDFPDDLRAEIEAALKRAIATASNDRRPTLRPISRKVFPSTGASSNTVRPINWTAPPANSVRSVAAVDSSNAKVSRASSRSVKM